MGVVWGHPWQMHLLRVSQARLRGESRWAERVQGDWAACGRRRRASAVMAVATMAVMAAAAVAAEGRIARAVGVRGRVRTWGVTGAGCDKWLCVS